MRPRNLGGRLPLLDPAKLSETQRKVYDLAIATMVPWADAAHFQIKTADGRLIGPFNPVLFAPEMGSCFADLQAAEARYTPLSERVPPSGDPRSRRGVESGLRTLRSFGSRP